MNAQLRVDHGGVIGAHPACAGWMIDGLGVLQDVIDDLIIGNSVLRMRGVAGSAG